MSKSLQDQLLNKGLISKDQANKTKSKKQKHKKKGNSGPDSDNEIKQHTQKARDAKVARDQALNVERKLAQETKAIQSQIKQLIQSNQIDRAGGELAYNFTDDKKIKKIYINQELTQQLSTGRICLVKYGGTYELIPRTVAEKIQQRDASCILVINDKTTHDETNDPYADYQIPDDLTW